MDKTTFERLLYEEESTTLDFKKEQYKFARATEDEKSEILKDILGFANAWRRSEAYIIVGVEEVRGGQSLVNGISNTDQLTDHTLQQFVNNLTNRPIQFHYEAFSYNGSQVGIFRIEQQDRPFYLRRDYGRLQKEKVYVRRGTSTDPSQPATLDEIASMRTQSDTPAAEMSVQFAEVDSESCIGEKWSLAAQYCDMPAEDSIPDFSGFRATQNSQYVMPVFSPLTEENADYYRRFAFYEFTRRLARETRFLVTNVGRVQAENVVCEFTCIDGNGMTMMDVSELPSLPHKTRSLLATPSFPSRFNQTHTVGEVVVERKGSVCKASLYCGNIQPGRSVCSDRVAIIVGKSGTLELKGKVYAANLPKPGEISLTIDAKIEQLSVDIVELIQLANSPRSDDDE